jgi:hypothetical protein
MPEALHASTNAKSHAQRPVLLNNATFSAQPGIAPMIHIAAVKSPCIFMQGLGSHNDQL